MAKFEKWLEPEGLALIGGWARDGLTDEQIARNMGVSRSTLQEWRKRFPVISTTLKRNKDVADREVENALYKNAVGYAYTESTRELRYNRTTGQYEMIVTREVVKHVKPDTVAQIFWLKNRRPDLWRDKQDVDAHVDGALNIHIDYGDEADGAEHSG